MEKLVEDSINQPIRERLRLQINSKECLKKKGFREDISDLCGDQSVPVKALRQLTVGI